MDIQALNTWPLLTSIFFLSYRLVALRISQAQGI